MNRLASEASPYLLQHADNPVDWYPWGEEALAEAQRSDRPILLSVGYSSCHWCHVMAHESFEDPAIASMMNDLFVNIKVDREERPDIDDLYMRALQALTGSGGWPMTVFLTPAGEPFAAGTYFPKTPRAGMVGFAEVLRRVRAAWDDDRPDVLAQGAELTAALARSHHGELETATTLDALVGHAVDALVATADTTHGGFGAPPKFPQAMNHELLLRRHHRSADPLLGDIVRTSLDGMASGGIYDHLAGGFARYSTDAAWIVPHFEKMLYDNALLTRLYLHSWQLTGREDHLQVVDETITFVLDELRHPGGGFFASHDADSEGEEGRYYLWTPSQIEAVLGDDTNEFSSWYGITAEGNFEGRNILWRPAGQELVRPISVELSRQRIRSAREMRIAPDVDTKVVTEWNGLMLSALAEAAVVTANQRWLQAAVRNGEFLLANLRRDDGRWMRSWRQGHGPGQLGTAADLAAVIDGFTRLSEASGQARWLDEGSQVADQLIELFWDDVGGGLFSTGSDAPALVARLKDVVDDATPSSNSAAAVALTRLAALTGNSRYRERAIDTVQALLPLVARHPTAFGHLLCAADMIDSEMAQIVIPGEHEDLLDVVRVRYLPNAVLAWGEPHDSPLWEGRQSGRAYVCTGFACNEPVSSPAALAGQLDRL